MNTRAEYRVLVFKTNIQPEKDNHTIAGALGYKVDRWSLEKRKDFVALYVRCNIDPEQIAALIAKVGFECELYYGEKQQEEV